MKQLVRYLQSPFPILILLIGFAVTCVNAQVYYKWVDADGKITYQDYPPQEGVDFEERPYDAAGRAKAEVEEQDTDTLLETAVAASPVSFYSIPECPACDLTRLYLESLLVPFAEKAVHEDAALQQELKDRSGGLLVPTVIIGDAVIDGYSKSALYETLSDKGYPLDRLKFRKNSPDGDSDGQQ